MTKTTTKEEIYIIIASHLIKVIKDTILLINLSQFASNWASMTRIASKEKRYRIITSHLVIVIKDTILLINLS